MSYDEAPANQSNDDASSLQARRARLRGSLAKQAIPPDPYKPDPYLSVGQAANSSATNQSPVAVTATNSASQQPAGETVNDNQDKSPDHNPPSPSNGHGQAQTPAPPLFAAAAGAAGMISAPYMTDQQPDPYDSPYGQQPQTISGSSPFIQETQPVGTSSPFTENAYTSAAASSYSQESKYVQPDGQDSPFGQAAASHSVYGQLPTPNSPFSQNAAYTPKAPAAGSTPAESSPIGLSAMSTLSESLASLRTQTPEAAEMSEDAATAFVEKEENNTKDRRSQKSTKPHKVFKEEEIPDEEFQAPAVIPPNEPAKNSVTVQSIHLQDPLATNSAAQVQVIELLNNMDQAMGACAMNLSALQKTAGEQTEALRSLTETLQHQTFSELGLNLTSLMESLSAALEPMKAVGELVPAIDQLVAVMEAKVVREEPMIKMSPEHLVISLADQLGAGVIDGWTFKSAYTAVFPDEQPADLLHRLVELLGSQRLTGDLFRSAYDAVQSPDQPRGAGAGNATAGGAVEIIEKEVIKVVQDEAMLQQLEQLKRSQESFEVKMKQRETEFAEMLGAKEQELQEAQELLNSRWEEFNTRYDELTSSLQKRDEVIQEKDAEIARKESENVQLRAQMEELREMMTELQKQFSGKPKEDSQKAASGFFDTAPGAAPKPAQSPSLFDADPSKPLFQAQGEGLQGNQQQQQQQQPLAQQQQVNQNMQAQMPQPVQQVPQQQQQAPPQQQAPQPMPQALPSSQAVPRQAQATTPFAGAGPGSYGSGVRAQVFEVIVRQALAGAPWREICAGPMQVNNISPDEVESEVKRRQALLGKK